MLREGQDDKLRITRWAPDGRKSALAFFTKVLEIWCDLMAGDEGVSAAMNGTATLSDVVIDEARRMVQRVLEVLTAEVGELSAEVGKCHLTLGMIQQFLGAAQEATECYSTAVKVLSSDGIGPAAMPLRDQAEARLAETNV